MLVRMRNHCANCVYKLYNKWRCILPLLFVLWMQLRQGIIEQVYFNGGGEIYDTTINYRIITLHFVTSHYYVRSAEIISNLNHSTATTTEVTELSLFSFFCVFSFSVVSFCSWNKRKGILTTKSIPKYREKTHKWINYSCSLAKSSNKSTPC